jgi:hypothetical protein
VLPGVRRQSLDRRLDPVFVVGVGEEGAVRAAPIGCAAGDDPVTRLAEDAGPAGQQPSEIGTYDVLGVLRVDELDPLTGEVERDFLAPRILGVVDEDVQACHLVSLRAHNAFPALVTVSRKRYMRGAYPIPDLRFAYAPRCP